MGTVGVEGHGHAPRGEHGAERVHHRRGALSAGGELGEEALLGRIVDDTDERQEGVGDESEPVMVAAIETEQFAEARPRLAATPVAAARAVLGDEARALERLLYKGVAERDAVLAAGLAEEVADVEAEVVAPI